MTTIRTASIHCPPHQPRFPHSPYDQFDTRCPFSPKSQRRPVPLGGPKLEQELRISKRSAGQFNPKNWFSEGDGLLASAAKTRETWTDHRRAFSQTVRNQGSEKSDRASDWNLLTGLPRASMLLLAYSVEMYLKAGMAKAYYGCSARMFERDIKGRLGHRLVSMAKELAFNLKDGDETNLALLKDMMLFDARYPVFVPEGASYADTVNRQTEESGVLATLRIFRN